ncbi:MAG: hypothetical protein NTY35_07615 [Planctomycetota bacterium]|nr:hypothetical protein [Planctomycetota bacterium]
MTERKSLSGGDWLAIGTFLVGTLVAVLMAYGLWTGAGGAAGTGAMAAAIAGAVGPWPALIGGAGIALLGARGFLTGERAGLLAGVLGVLGVAAGLSVVAGALSELRGGSFGAGTGGRIAEMAHPAVGVLLGAIVAFGAAYFAWMREDPAAAARLAPARRLTPAPPKSDDGVTAAESAMLFPAEEDELSPARPIPPPAKPVKPLYPEDVRLKGEVPAGAKPLTPPMAYSDAPAIPVVPEPAVYRWTAPRAAADPTRIAPEEIEALADTEPSSPAFTPSAAVDANADAAEEVEERPMPPRPTWETTGLTEDDEPVDAYGTPLSLVEKARRDRDEVEDEVREVEPVVAARIPREIGEVDPDALAGDRLEDEEQDEDEPLVVADVVVIEVEEDLAAAGKAEAEPAVLTVSDEAAARSEVSALLAQQESLLQELRANNAALRADQDVQDEYDEIEAEVVSASSEVEPVAVLEAAFDEELLDEEDEVEEEVLEVVSVSVSEGELEDEAEEAFELEEETEPAQAEVAPVPEPEPEEADEPAPVVAAAPVAAPRAKVAVAAPSLFDAVETEPQVVLQPQAAVPASRATKAPGRGIDPEKKLLVEVGCMFVERGRVAVSMLQRQYDMDFDQACRVLDDLQEMGLIGPYMGGKNREILLSKDQWLEKVGAAVD